MTTPSQIADQILDLISRLEYEVHILANHTTDIHYHVLRHHIKTDLLDIIQQNTDTPPTHTDAAQPTTATTSPITHNIFQLMVDQYPSIVICALFDEPEIHDRHREFLHDEISNILLANTHQTERPDQ